MPVVTIVILILAAGFTASVIWLNIVRNRPVFRYQCPACGHYFDNQYQIETLQRFGACNTCWHDAHEKSKIEELVRIKSYKGACQDKTFRPTQYTIDNLKTGPEGLTAIINSINGKPTRHPIKIRFDKQRQQWVNRETNEILYGIFTQKPKKQYRM